MRRIVNVSEFAEILQECVSYLEDTDESSINGYFAEFIDSGLFQDAIGKVIGVVGEDVVVTTDY